MYKVWKKNNACIDIFIVINVKICVKIFCCLRNYVRLTNIFIFDRNIFICLQEIILVKNNILYQS